MGCSVKDTFFVDPRVEGCDGLSSRAKRLGLQLKGFLGEGVTVCIAATSSSSSSGGAGGGAGKGLNEGTGDETAGAGAGVGARAGFSRGQRLSRIHRMVIQAQTEPTAGSGPAGRRQGHTSIADQARQLHATVLSGKAFGLWLERQESKRAAARGEGVARAGAGAAAAAAAAAAACGGTGGGPARTLVSRGQRAATSRFKSQEHPRVVMKDLDGLEPDRVQAFPPELLRKCNLHTDAPPGMCPFIPREQWDREVLKMKKKDALCSAAKVAARMPPAGAHKPRRGGWCECCESQYFRTMSEHCAGDQHRAAVAADPNYAVLLELESWTGSDAESVAHTVAHGPTPAAAEAASTISSSSSTAAAAGAAEVGAGGGNATSTVKVRVASASNERDDECGYSLAPAGESDISPGGRDDASKPGAAAGRASPMYCRRGFSPPTRRDVVNAKQETPATEKDSALRDAVSPSGLRVSAGAPTGVRVLRSSPRRYPKPGQEASSAPCSKPAGAGAGAGGGTGGGGGGGGGVGVGGECVSLKAAPSVEQPRPGNLKRSQRGGSRGSDDAISTREARKDEGGASTGVVAGTLPQQSTATKRRTRSSPLACSSSTCTPEGLCAPTAVLNKDASGLRKDCVGEGSPATAAADTPATSVLSNSSSQTDRSKRSSSSSGKKARCPSESPPSSTQPRGGAFSPSSSRRAGRNSRRLGSSPASGCKGETSGSRSGTASPEVRAEMVRRNSRARHGSGIEAGSSTIVSGDPGTLPSCRAKSMDTAAQKHSPTHSALRPDGGKPERVSALSPLSDAKKEDHVKLEKRRERVLKMLADSPDFHGGAASPAASTSRVRTCDARGRSVTTTGSGSRRCSRDRGDGDGSATKMGSGGKTRRTNNRSGPSKGSMEEEWRVKKKCKRRNYDETGGGPSTASDLPRESVAQTVGAAGGKMEQETERPSDGSKSARARRRRGCASSPDNPREEERLKRASLPVDSGGDKDNSSSSSRSKGGTRTRSKRRTPSTAGRMGLEAAGDSSDDSGDGSAEDASQQSSPLFSERHRSVPRSLGSRFAEHHGDATATAARRKHSPVGASSKSGPSGKRARATLPTSPRRIRA